jgi:hypothetical protein
LVSRRVGKLLFGDRVGLAIWLGLVLGLALTWRVGFFITDTYAVANTVIAVSEGQLAVTEVRYAPSILQQPGLHEADGQLYGRNYGQIVLAVPFVYFLQVGTLFAPLQILLAGLWSATLLGFGRQLARIFERDSIRFWLGPVAVLAFVLNVIGAEGIKPARLHLVALQLSTLALTAFAGVLAYRLLDLMHGRSVGIAAGIATGLATPLAVWATVPKRHVLVATVMLGIVYSFAESRHAGGRRAAAGLVSAYLLAGFIFWVHAFEGAFVFASLVLVDLLTDTTRSPRLYLARVAAFAIGLLPMVLTNITISGSVFQPPRLLDQAGQSDLGIAPSGDVVNPESGANGEAKSGSNGNIAAPAEDFDSANTFDNQGDGGGVEASFDQLQTTEGDGGSRAADTMANKQGQWPGAESIGYLLSTSFVGSVANIEFILDFLARIIGQGLDVLQEPGRLSHIFLRSGQVPGIDHQLNDFEAIDLTVLESSPLLGAILAIPFVLAAFVKRFVNGSIQRYWPLQPERQTDLLVIMMAGTFTVAYLHKLPLHSQITVRYILPAIAVGMYLVARLPPVREVLTDKPRRLASRYCFVLITAVFLVAWVVSAWDLAIGEAMQFQALLNLSAAGILALAIGGRSVAPSHVSRQVVASALALAAGLSTALVTLMAFSYFQYGTYAIPVGGYLAGLFPVV